MGRPIPSPLGWARQEVGALPQVEFVDVTPVWLSGCAPGSFGALPQVEFVTVGPAVVGMGRPIPSPLGWARQEVGALPQVEFAGVALA
jgi:hypothetical protein